MTTSKSDKLARIKSILEEPETEAKPATVRDVVLKLLEELTAHNPEAGELPVFSSVLTAVADSVAVDGKRKIDDRDWISLLRDLAGQLPAGNSKAYYIVATAIESASLVYAKNVHASAKA